MNKLVLGLFLAVFLAGSSLAGEFNITLSPSAAQQGRCLAVVLVSPEGVAEAKVVFLNQSFKFYQSDDSFRGLAGIPSDQRPGDYPLTLIVTGPDGSRDEVNRTIKVRKTKFPFVSFWLKPAKKKLFTGDLIAREWARIEKTLLVEFERQRWRGLFTLPAKGPTSMVFGTIERVNGRRTGQHRGLDIAVPMGTKIKAPNHGRVVFAEHLKAFGGTIVLDHGQGVHTLYFHLSKFLAKVGQEVSKGDIIALSGNSGISSGPHLHWGMSVHNLRVDPGQWTRMAF